MSSAESKAAIDFCYEGDPDLLPVAEAQRRIAAHTPVISETESVSLDDALQRILAEDVVSPADVPSHTNSAMDGYALRCAELPETGTRRFQVARENITHAVRCSQSDMPGKWYCFRLHQVAA